MPLLSLDLRDPDAVLYFLWDDPMTVRTFRKLLTNGTEAERLRSTAKLLREARDEDVWLFVSPEDVAELWAGLQPLLGRRRAFWEYLLGAWRREGLLA